MEKDKMSSTTVRINGNSYSIGDLVKVWIPSPDGFGICRVGMVAKFYSDLSMNAMLRHTLKGETRDYYLVKLILTNDSTISCKFNRFPSAHKFIKTMLTYGALLNHNEEVRKASTYIIKNKQDGQD